MRCLAVLLLSSAAIGQAPTEWKPVLPEELALTDNPSLPGAPAMLLDRDSYVDDAKSYLTEYYRIKIFKEEGREFADIEIPYVPKADEVQDIKARTVRPDGTTSEFHGEVFDRVIVKSKRQKYQAKTFTLPDAQVGGILEYSYKMVWHQHAPDVLKNPQSYLIDGIYTIPTIHWQIQHELYTRHARFVLHPLPKTALQWALIRMPKGADVQRQVDGTAVLEVRDVPPLDKEEYMPPDDYINSRVHFYYILGAYAGVDPQYYWPQLGNRETKSVENFIGHSKFVAQISAQTISPTDTDDVKLRKIYDRVQQIRYLSYEPLKTDKESKRENIKDNKNAEDVLRHGYAFVNEINYLFAAMVRAAGFQAYVVKVVERDKHIFDQIVLDPSQFNAMVINVHIGDTDRFFDPATMFCPFELVPWAESGVKGLRLAPLSGLVSVPGYHSPTAVTHRTATLKIAPDGTLKGTFHVSFSGQEALTRRLAEYDDDDVGRRKSLESELKGWLPENAQIEITSSNGWDTSQGNLEVDGEVSVADFATVAGRRLLVPVSVFHHTKENPFKPQSRSYPIYFSYSYRAEDDIKLIVPEGLGVESLPTERIQTMGSSRFQFSAKQTLAGMDLKRSLDLDGFIYDKSNYGAVKHFFEVVLGADSEQAVLQRSGPAN